MLQNRFVEVIVTGLSARLAAAIALLPVALLLIGQAYPALWKNEGRAHFAPEAASAEVIRADRPGDVEGRLVSVTGAVHATERAGDRELLAPGPWLAVIRQVETHAWEESVDVDEERMWGGRLRTTTTIEYAMDRTARVLTPGEMVHPDGHENPGERWRSQAFLAPGAHIGALRVDPAQLAGVAPVPLDPAQVTRVGEAADAPIVDGAVFLGQGTPEHPELGDQWVRWYVIPDGVGVTAFGEVIGGQLREHPWKAGMNLLIAFEGERDEALQMLRGIDSMVTWAIRFGGLFALWVGFFLLLGPLFVLVDIVPPLGLLVRIAAGILLVLPTLLTGVGVILVSQTVHSTPALLLLGLGGAYAVYASIRLRRDLARTGSR